MTPASRTPTIPDHVWEKLREPIEERYIGQRLSLQEVMQDMRYQYDFRATDKQYKRQLARWGMRKNIPTKAMDVVLSAPTDDPRIESIRSQYRVTNTKINKFRHRKGQKLPHDGILLSSPASSLQDSCADNSGLAEVSMNPLGNDHHVWRPDQTSFNEFPFNLDLERLMTVTLVCAFRDPSLQLTWLDR